MTVDSSGGERPPEKLDSSVPQSARVWNYWLVRQPPFVIMAEAGGNRAATA